MHNSLVCICFIAWEMWRVPPLGGGVVTAMPRDEPGVDTSSTQTQGDMLEPRTCLCSP